MIFLKLTIIFSIITMANGMIDWMFRNFISKKANVVLKICISLIRTFVDYCIQA